MPEIDGLTVLTGVEAKILDVDGSVDAPPELLASIGEPGGPDRILLADHQVPGPDGPWSPRATLERMVDGLDPADVVDRTTGERPLVRGGAVLLPAYGMAWLTSGV